jgi:uncharacterized protein (UPF0332 family)
MASARERIEAAHAALADGFASVAVSAAYYAALYAARAALSEQDRNAKTHRGAWSLFAELFVATERLEPGLFAPIRRVQELREAADYDARQISEDQARAVICDAESFVSAVAELLGA